MSDDAETPQSSTQEKLLSGMGDDEPVLAGKRVSGEGTRETPKEAQWPDENGKAHRGQTKLDQQGVQTQRDRQREPGGDAGESQSSERNIESGLRGNQDSQRRHAERGRNDGQKQEPLLVSGRHGGNPEARTTRIGVLERVGFEKTCWLDMRRFVGGNRWLDDGGPETQQRSRSKEEKTARDDREGINERCQNGRRCHGWFGWFSVVMRVQTRILQAIFECKQHEKEKEFGTVDCCDRSSVLESVELECRWSGRRLYRYFLVADFNARRLGCVAVARMFQKTGWSERGCSRIVHAVRTPWRIAMSGSYRQSEMERTIEECRRCGKMDYGRAGWTADPHFSLTKEENWENSRLL